MNCRLVKGGVCPVALESVVMVKDTSVYTVEGTEMASCTAAWALSCPPAPLDHVRVKKRQRRKKGEEQCVREGEVMGRERSKQEQEKEQNWPQ